MEFGEKLAATIISEVVEALGLIIIIIVLSTLGETNEIVKPIAGQMIAAFVAGWALLGIATPFVIFLDLLEPIGESLRGLGNVRIR